MKTYKNKSEVISEKRKVLHLEITYISDAHRCDTVSTRGKCLNVTLSYYEMLIWPHAARIMI